jgi:hypothetical protein
MTVPRKSKPEEAAETARVMRIFDWLFEELDKRNRQTMMASFPWRDRAVDVLAVAERIAARTETPT